MINIIKPVAAVRWPPHLTEEKEVEAVARKYQKRYHEYRGRRNSGSVVLKIIIALLVLTLLACLVFMVFLGGRVEYTDDGVRIVMPWSEHEPDASAAPDETMPPVIIVE